ncbi:uroporphyrinogen-III C-methyltransferase [Roseibium sediminicola]|uniref:uroporphyrinogen-III C-methyltransferase n=1 Tax=Roseibium sediminicola TaxID=2933272 RepID=A0ABT0GPS3_9HYPH|nr:uroporphyrinogen-III C-methyltransferase [Roseibium sp. CAU 1639]MCK7611097.1 uroporphyrinogen-III C-methyltransferase [Roseibium sp. CAU 1639]
MTGKVFLIGAGPGDPELLTLRAMRMLQAADAVVFDRLVSPEILALAPEGVLKVPVGKSADNHPVPQERINKILVDLALEGRTVARLKGGDPLIFGRGSEEAEHLAAHGIAVEYAPGITAAQGAAAATGVPLTHRGLATGVRYVTGHRQANGTLDLDWNSLASAETTLVVYMGVANMGQIAMRLVAEGLSETTPVLAIANATTPREKRLFSQLGRIALDVRDAELTAPVLFVIGKVVTLSAEWSAQDLKSLMTTADSGAAGRRIHA